MAYSPLLDKLIKQLRFLPGVGPKSAQRMAFHLLNGRRQEGIQLATTLKEALIQIQHCQSCRNLTEHEICSICADNKRDKHLLCILESPADVIAMEQTSSYKGLYFVLMGHLSPIDGIGPKDIGLDQLEQRMQQEDIEELILATNPTSEGEATAHYIAETAKTHNIKASRIAYGVPIGGELEYVDSGTLTRALTGREFL
jgi:recombination protein RecR